MKSFCETIGMNWCLVLLGCSVHVWVVRTLRRERVAFSSKNSDVSLSLLFAKIVAWLTNNVQTRGMFLETKDENNKDRVVSTVNRAFGRLM